MNNENIEWDRIVTYNTQASEKYNNEGLVKCEFCNRTFFDHRMAGHKKICTKEKPRNVLSPSDFRKNKRYKSMPKYQESVNIHCFLLCFI